MTIRLQAGRRSRDSRPGRIIRFVHSAFQRVQNIKGGIPMKKLLALVLSLAMVLAIAAPVLADGPVTITYAHFSGSGAQEETLKKMVEAFEAKNPDISNL